MRLGNMKENDLVIIKNQVTSYLNKIPEVRFSYEDLAQPQLWTDKEGNKNRKVFKIT